MPPGVPARSACLTTTYQIFERAGRIETLSAQIYHLLSERFDGVPGAKDLFGRLEEEEAQHEARIRLLAARYRHDSRLLALPPSPAALDIILEDAEEVLRSIREGRFARGFEEVRVNLAALEERFAVAHAEIIAGEGHPDLRDFFKKLSAQDRGHRDLLRGPVKGQPLRSP